MKDAGSRLAAWLNDELTQALLVGLFLSWALDQVRWAHERIDNMEDDLNGIVCRLPLTVVHGA